MLVFAQQVVETLGGSSHPDTVLARVDRSTWTPPAVFTTLQQLGNVPRDDIERTLNMGVGFVAVLPADSVDRATSVLAERGIRSWAIGDVQALDGASLDSAAEVVRGAKGVDGGSVGLLLVAAADPACGRKRGGLGDADELEREVPVGLVAGPDVGRDDAHLGLALGGVAQTVPGALRTAPFWDSIARPMPAAAMPADAIRAT